MAGTEGGKVVTQEAEAWLPPPDWTVGERSMARRSGRSGETPREEYGSGFAEKSQCRAARTVQCAVTFAQERIVATLSRHLIWSHFPAQNPGKRRISCYDPRK